MAVPLPPPALRWGGPHLKDDEVFRRSARELAGQVQRLAGVGTDSELIDVGCGPGRLLIGITERLGSVGRYVGVDTNRKVVEWAAENLSSPWSDFRHIAFHNARYNDAAGRPDDPGFLPFDDAEFDAAALHSVFSHMVLDDIALYLTEVARLLKPGGRAYCTAFVEPDVPDWAENPDDYGGPWKGALHCVRLNRATFEAMVADAGLAVDAFVYRPVNQSSYGLVRT